jgi:hypothetical protein
VDALKRAHVRDLATYLERAYDRLEARDIDGCIAFCRMILAREPNYCVAADLLESAEILRRREEYFDFLMAKVSGWKKLTSNGPKPDVPYESELEYPGLGVEKAKRPTSVGVSTMD